MNGEDSNLIRFVRKGESALERVKRDLDLRRVTGVICLALAALLFLPSWFLIPSLVFAGLSLLSFNPFEFGACGGNSRRGADGSSPAESVKT